MAIGEEDSSNSILSGWNEQSTMVIRIYGQRPSTAVRGTECTLMTDKNCANICKLIYGRAFVRETGLTTVVLMWSGWTDLRYDDYFVTEQFLLFEKCVRILTK